MVNPSSNIALMPTAGMGHVTPFLRLASKLLSFGCRVTVITAKPIFTIAEANHFSSFFAQHPEANHLEYQVLPPENTTGVDPFFLQYDAIGRSVHQAFPLLKSFTTIICDLLMASSVPQYASEIAVPCFVFITTSARFLSFLSHVPQIVAGPEKLDLASPSLVVKGFLPFDMKSIPPLFINVDHFLCKFSVKNARCFKDATGLILNTFDWLESETLSDFEKARHSTALPPAIPLGPLDEYNTETSGAPHTEWLNKQAAESVVYINFGSRTAASQDQIRELGLGLEKSKFKFLWVVKTSMVDKEEKDELENVLGVEFLERTKEQGLILKEWVKQSEILSHPATGGFVSHCGWNSVIEAAQRGVPILGWPQHGDQRVNAELVERVGLGRMEKRWGFGLATFVTADEVAKTITELMTDCNIRRSAKKVMAKAKKATAVGGTSYMNISNEFSANSSSI